MTFEQAKKHFQLCLALLEIPHRMTNMYNDFLTRILSKLQALGWSLAASADVSAKFYKHKEREFPLDVHSWFLLYSPESIAPSGEELQTKSFVDNVNQDGTENFQEILSERQCCTPAMKACGYCWGFILIVVSIVVIMEITRPLWCGGETPCQVQQRLIGIRVTLQ